MWQDLKNIYHTLSALLACCMYGFPARRLKVIGVTGTDGKTTTTHLIHHILKSCGKKASLVSSVYAEIAQKKYDTGFHVTTPDAWALQRFLHEALKQGDRYIVLEITSHAIDQNRMFGINFLVGVLTNVSHEHLDYHKTYTAYLKTKEKLLHQSQSAVVNRDDESFGYLSKQTLIKSHTYGLSDSADTNPKNFQFRTRLPGIYNQYNCLAAVAACQILDIPEEKIITAIAGFKGVVGRFEEVETHKGFRVIIDFAHTPNAFKQVLTTLKPDVSGKLIHVFGCAALRDTSKRPIMGQVSAEFADYIVLTEEDYRTEDVNEIIDQIAAGCIKRKAIEGNIHNFVRNKFHPTPVFFRIPNRQDAINFAIQKFARPNDVVILTGKAHEKSLCRGITEYPWSEHQAVNKALKSL